MSGDGGPAFPHDFRDFEGVKYMPADGASLRDYFAASAMQEFLMSTLRQNRRDADEGTAIDIVAADAYAMADAMLAEREKKA